MTMKVTYQVLLANVEQSVIVLDVNVFHSIYIFFLGKKFVGSIMCFVWIMTMSVTYQV